MTAVTVSFQNNYNINYKQGRFHELKYFLTHLEAEIQ